MKRIWAEQGTDPSRLHSLLLAVFFFLGTAAGIGYAGRTAGNVGGELSAYLAGYLSLSENRKPSGAQLASLVFSYLRFPAAAFLAGFTSVGALLLPLLTAALGFFPAYAVSCFAMSFGAQGIWAALGLFGFRCLVTFPCYFLLAAPSWSMSAALFRVSFGRGHPFSPVYDRRWWLRFAGVLLVLCLGIATDLRLSPFLLRILQGRVF